MMADGETAIVGRDDRRKLEADVAEHYQEFYENKAAYEIKKDGENFLVTLVENPVITMEEILLDIQD